MKKIQINKIRCIFGSVTRCCCAVFLNGCGILLEDRTFALSLSVVTKRVNIWSGMAFQIYTMR